MKPNAATIMLVADDATLDRRIESLWPDRELNVCREPSIAHALERFESQPCDLLIITSSAFRAGEVVGVELLDVFAAGPARTRVLFLVEPKHMHVATSAAGLAPLVRDTISASLHELRRGSFALIVVDRDHADVDVLELILNVRDIDQRTPVLVVGSGAGQEDDSLLATQPLAFVLGDRPTPAQLTGEIEQVLMMTDNARSE
ncbi:hypothetical protein HQ560_11150 [bacterium]|nr:hypothetical protein [bacterium]